MDDPFLSPEQRNRIARGEKIFRVLGYIVQALIAFAILASLAGAPRFD